MFLKNKNIIFKIIRSKVTDYVALSGLYILDADCLSFVDENTGFRLLL